MSILVLIEASLMAIEKIRSATSSNVGCWPSNLAHWTRAIPSIMVAELLGSESASGAFFLMLVAKAALLVFQRLPSGAASDQGSGPRGKHSTSFMLRSLFCLMTIILPNNHLSAFKIAYQPSAHFVCLFFAADPNVFGELFFMGLWKFFTGGSVSSLSALNVV